MRPRSELLADVLIELEKHSVDPTLNTDSTLRAEVEEAHMQELAIESAIDGVPTDSSELPIFLVSIAQDITTIPPGQSVSEINKITRTRPAVLILRPSDEQRFGHSPEEFTPEDLLPRDLGLRVFGNWKVIEVQRCETTEPKTPAENETNEDERRSTS